ncbi:hypothetical protein E4U59_001399 [Claviceps monticola]|nr:hypothetical protein E4U59_001399 [Claviceps monticola]
MRQTPDPIAKSLRRKQKQRLKRGIHNKGAPSASEEIESVNRLLLVADIGLAEPRIVNKAVAGEKDTRVVSQLGSLPPKLRTGEDLIPFEGGRFGECAFWLKAQLVNHQGLIVVKKRCDELWRAVASCGENTDDGKLGEA